MGALSKCLCCVNECGLIREARQEQRAEKGTADLQTQSLLSRRVEIRGIEVLPERPLCVRKRKRRWICCGAGTKSKMKSYSLNMFAYIVR
jgi:hypothetical protein